MITTLRNDLEFRRRAIARAFRAVMTEPPSPTRVDIDTLHERVESLSQRLEEITHDVDAMRTRGLAFADRIPVIAPAVEDEPPAGRVAVPPVTPATISNHAFDVLLGAATDAVTAESQPA